MVTEALQLSGQVHLATAMDLAERLDPSVEALELQTWVVFQHPGLKALGVDRSFEVGNPLAQIVDGVGPAALFAPRACRPCFRRLRCRPGALPVALDAEISDAP